MTSNWHAVQSIHNKDTSDFLNTKTPAYVDWEITSLFYSALHLVDAYCAKNQAEQQLSNHRERSKFVRENLSSSYESYKKLYDPSIKSRYLKGGKINPSWLNIAKNNYDALKSSLP